MLPSVTGTYTAKLGSWKGAPFRRLELTNELVGGRHTFHAEVDNLATCLVWAGVDPCPPSRHLDGTYTWDLRAITFESSTTDEKLIPLLGRYDYAFTSSELSLKRPGFEQKLEVDVCAGKSEAACSDQAGCEPVYGPSVCSANGLCTADMIFKSCQRAGTP